MLWNWLFMISETSVQSLSCVQLFVTPWTAVHQTSLAITWEACSNSCLSSQWCHPTISSSVVPFSCLQSFPALGCFPISLLFASGGQSTGALASALVLSMNIQGWFPLECTGLITKSLIWKDHWLISPSYNVPDRSPSCLVWMFLLMVSFQYP